MTDTDLRVQKLIARLQSPDYVRRLHAGCRLTQMGSAAREAIPALLELLRLGDTADRKLAAWALGYLGQGADQATTALRAAARDSDESVRLLATSALEKIAASPPSSAAA